MTDIAWRRRLRRAAALVVALTIATVATMIFLGGGFAPIGAALVHPPPWAIALAVGCTLLEWAFDALRFAIAGRVFGFRASPATWLRVALINLSAAYMANVGPAVSAWVLARRGMAPGQALALSLAKQIIFFPVALAPAWIVASVAPGIGPEVRVSLELIGAVCLAGLILVLVLARNPGRVRAFLERVLRRRAGGEFVEQFLAAMRTFFFERRRLLLASVAAAVANQLAILGTVVALAHGLSATGPVVGTSYLFTTLSQVAPTPGGAGMTEAGGALLFRDALSPSVLVAFLLLARFLTIQLPILFGGWLVARDLHASDV